VSDLTGAEERLIHGLRRRKVREREALCLAGGVRVVEEVLGAGTPVRLAVLSPGLDETERGRSLGAELEKAAPVRRVTEHVLARLSPTETPQGVLVVAGVPEPIRLETLEPRAREALLVLDGVQDPGNAGTLIRTAAAFGARVACLPGTVDAWNPKTIRASAGTVFREPPILTDAAALASWSLEHDVAVLGADAAGDPLDTASLPARVALVVGNEGTGLSADVQALLRARVAIPMRGDVESLNVAVSAAILLFLVTEGRWSGS